MNALAANQSPVKKKLSLSDYTKSRMNKVAARPSVGTTTLKPEKRKRENQTPKSNPFAYVVADKYVGVWMAVSKKEKKTRR